MIRCDCQRPGAVMCRSCARRYRLDLTADRRGVWARFTDWLTGR